jgi:hypothetical protein
MKISSYWHRWMLATNTILILFYVAAQPQPARLFNRDALGKPDKNDGHFYVNGIYSATEQQLSTLHKFEDQAIANVIKDHFLDPTDAPAVLSWARDEALANLYILMFQAFQASIDGVATPDQLSANNWVWGAYNRQVYLDAINAGFEYTKWAGIGTAAYTTLTEQDFTYEQLMDFFDAQPQPYTGVNPGEISDGGFCTYFPPSPLDDDAYTGNIYNGNADQICYVSNPDPTTLGLFPPTIPSVDLFRAFGIARTKNILFSEIDAAKEFSKMAVSLSMNSLVGLEIIAYGLGSSIIVLPLAAGTGLIKIFAKVVFPFAIRAASAGGVAFVGAAAIFSAIIFATAVAVQVALQLVESGQTREKIARLVSGAKEMEDINYFDLYKLYYEGGFFKQNPQIEQELTTGFFLLVFGAVLPAPKPLTCEETTIISDFGPPGAACLNPTPIWEPSSLDHKWNVTINSESFSTSTLSIVVDSTTNLTSTKRLHGNWVVSMDVIDSVNKTSASLNFLYVDWNGTVHNAWVFAHKNPAQFLTIALSKFDDDRTFDPTGCVIDGNCVLTTSINVIDKDGNKALVSIIRYIPPDNLPPPLPIYTCIPDGTTICLPRSETSTSITGPLTVPVGGSFTYTANVHYGGVSFEGGAVDFVLDNALQCSNVTLIDLSNITFRSLSAECKIKFLSLGPVMLYATYLGDNNRKPSQDGLSINVVEVSKLPTSTALLPTVPTAVVGQPISFAVKVSFPEDLFVIVGTERVPVNPDGRVALTIRLFLSQSSYTVCSNLRLHVEAMNQYIARCTYSFQEAGMMFVVPYYSGDWGTMSSAAYTGAGIQVTKAATTTSVTWSTNKPRPFVGNPIIFYATVKVDKPGNASPGGRFTFTDSLNNVICNVSSFCVKEFAIPGPVEIVATYSGDSKTNSSSSSTVVTIVELGSPTEVPSKTPSFRPSTSVSPSSVPSLPPSPPRPSSISLYGPTRIVVGSQVFFEVEVASTTTPSGTVSLTFKIGEISFLICGNVLLTAPTLNGILHKARANCTTSVAEVGTYITQASYSGDSFTQNAISSPFVLEVFKARTEVYISLLTPQPTVGQEITIASTVNVMDANVVPMGNLTFTDIFGIVLCANVKLPPTSPFEAICKAFLTEGFQIITISYSGDDKSESASSTSGIFNVVNSQSQAPSKIPSHMPSFAPSVYPSRSPSLTPEAVSPSPSKIPSHMPSLAPSVYPSLSPSSEPKFSIEQPSPMPKPVPKFSFAAFISYLFQLIVNLFSWF